MSIGDEGVGAIDPQTARGQRWPTITQFSVFLENRVGQLMDVARSFQGSKVKIVGLTISDAADCSVIRLILNHPEQGREILAKSGRAFAENELLAVELSPAASSLNDLCVALLRAEINIHYAYPLIVQPHGWPAVALHVESNEQAGRSLRDAGLHILCEADLAN